MTDIYIMDSFEKTIERKEESPVLNQTTNDPGTMAIDTTNMISTTPGSHQHPPPSPLSGCYLLVVLPEPHAIQHKHFILDKLAKGFLSWDKENCHVDLEKELEALVAQSPEGEEARNGERLIQYATENLVTEILIHPQTNTLLQCIRNLLASFTKHRHIIHAGYTFSENGSWILQDGTFSLADFFDAFNEHDVQRVLRAYENNVTIDISCAGIGEWSTERLSQEPSTRSCRIRLNPEDILSTRLPAITSFINYIEQYLVTQTLAQLMQPSDVVGNIRFSHPTLYVFPGGQGDAALFGINGFNMLVDGGFARKSCFWDFTRHLDRLDAVLFTRVNNSNIGGMSSFLRKKKETQVYPQIGHFFGNIFESKQLRSSDDNKDDDPLIISLIDLGQELVTNLKHIHLRPHLCYRRQDPINLYHKVGHGTLDMYVLSPVKDSREVKDFLSKWTAADHKLFADSHKKDSNNFAFPIRNMVSICALIVWQPANPEDTITRILFPGSTPQHTIFEGIERLKHLEFLKHPTCSAKNLSPAVSLATLKEKSTKLKMNQMDREIKRTNETKITKRETSEVKVSKIESQSQKQETKTKKTSDLEIKKVDNTKEYSKTMIDLKESKKNEKDIKDMKKESKKDSQKESEGKKFEMIKTNEEDKNIVNKELKRKIERKKQDPKDSKEIKITPPVGKIENKSESTNKKMKISTSKKPLTGLPTKPELLKTSMPKTTSKPSAKQIYPPAKSTKDANNRKVLEQKNIEKITSKQKPSPPAAPAEKKPVIRRIKSTSSPSKNRLPGSPMKVAKVTSTVPIKLEKDAIQKKLKIETEAADSSTVSTSSVVDMDSMKFVDKCLTEKSEDMSLDSIENKVLADLKEERQVVEEIEAVLQKAERIENTRDNLIKDKHGVSEDTGKKYEDLTEDDVTVEMDEIPRKSISRKASQELTEEDEYLIIEKEEMYTEDSVHSGETEHKHFLDVVETEKNLVHDSFTKEIEDQEIVRDDKEDDHNDDDDNYPSDYVGNEGYIDDDDNDDDDDDNDIDDENEDVEDVEDDGDDDNVLKKDKENDKDEKEREKNKEDRMDNEYHKGTEKDTVIEKGIVEEQEKSDKKIHDDSEIEKKEQQSTSISVSKDKKLEEEKIKGVISATTDINPKKGTHKELVETDSEVVNKEPSSSSPEKLNLEKKAKIDSDSKPEIGKDTQIREKFEESLERVSTLESGATTTAPTLPEDERISIEGMKPTSSEIVKQGKAEDIKKIETFAKSKTIPLAPIEVPELKFTSKELLTQHPIPALPRDIVKTPDEVADLPVHEEVDPKLYEIDNYDTSKEDKNQYTKESVISFKEQKNIPEVFSKPTDKCEKGINKINEGTRRDSEKDIDEKLFSKSGSPKKSFDVDELLSEKKTEKDHQLIHDDEQVDSKKIMGPKKEDKEIDIPETILTKKEITLDTHSLQIGEVNENVESVEDVEALLEEASKKFKTVKDSLRDSLESLEEHIVEEEFKKTTLELDNDNEIEGKLNKVAEKLEEIEPRKQNISTDMAAQNIKSDVLKNDSSDYVERSDTISPVKNIKDAVKDVGEVLAGTAGIIIDDKPKDVIDIVKKVAEVLKEDNFLPVQYPVQDKLKTEVEEDLNDKILSQDHHIKVLDTSSPIRSRSESITEAKLMCAELLKDNVVPHLQESVLSEDIISSDVDVLEVGIEKVCKKVNTNLQKDDSHQAISDVVTSEIAFDHKMIPTTAEVVLITPDSMPPSPKLSIELQEDTSVTEDVRNIIKNKDNIYDIIEDILLTEKSKISDKVLDFISTSKQISKQELIVIIDQIISKEYLLQSKVDEASKMSKVDEASKMSKVEKEIADDIKKHQLEDYIQESYLNKNIPITLEILEEIALKHSYPRFLIIEIIESIITMKGITKSSVINISEKALIQLAQEYVPTRDVIMDQKSSLDDKVTDDIQYDEVAQIPDKSVVDSTVWDSYESSDGIDEILKTVRKDEIVNKVVSDSSKDSSERSEKGSPTEAVDEIELNNRGKTKYRDEKEEVIEDIEKEDKNFDTESNIKLAKSSLTSLETTASSEVILTSDLKEQIISSKKQKGAEDEKMNMEAVQDKMISPSITPSTKDHSAEPEVSTKDDEKYIHTIDNSLTKTDKPFELDNSEISDNELSFSRKHSISKDQRALIEGEKDNNKILDTQTDDLSIIPKVLKTETVRSCEVDDEEDKKTAESSLVYNATISLDKMGNLEKYSASELDIIDSSSSQALITPTQNKYPVDSAENVQHLIGSHTTPALPESSERIELYKHQEDVKPQTFSKSSSPTSDKSLTENRKDESEVSTISTEIQPYVVPENLENLSATAESKDNNIEFVASQLDTSHPQKRNSIDQTKEGEIQKNSLVTSIDAAFVGIKDTIDGTEEQNEGTEPLTFSKSPSDKSLSEHGENKMKILTEKESKEVDASIHSKSPSPTSHKSITDDHKDKTEDLTIPTKSASSAFPEKAESSSPIARDKHDYCIETASQQNLSTDQERSLIDIQDTIDQPKKHREEEKSPILSKSTSPTSDRCVTDDHKNRTEDIAKPSKSSSFAVPKEVECPRPVAGDKHDDIEEATSQDISPVQKKSSIDQGKDIEVHRKDSVVSIDTTSGDIHETTDQPRKQKEEEKSPILSKSTSPTSDKSVIDDLKDKTEDLTIPTKSPSSAISEKAENLDPVAGDKHDDIEEAALQQNSSTVQVKGSIDQGEVEVHRKDSVVVIDTASGDIQDTTDQPKKQREEEKSPIFSKSTSPTSDKSVIDDPKDKAENIATPTESSSFAVPIEVENSMPVAGDAHDDIELAASQHDILPIQKKSSIDHSKAVEIHRKDSVASIDTASSNIQNTTGQSKKQREEEKSSTLSKSTSPTSNKSVIDEHKDKTEDIAMATESSSFAVSTEVENSILVAKKEHDDIEMAASQHNISPIHKKSSIDPGEDVEVHRKDSVDDIDIAFGDIQNTTDLPKKQIGEEKSSIFSKSTSPTSDKSVTDDHKDKTEDPTIPKKSPSSAFSETAASSSPVAGSKHDDIKPASSQQDIPPTQEKSLIDHGREVDVQRKNSGVAIATASSDIQDTTDQPEKQTPEEKSTILSKSASPTSVKSVTDDHEDETEDLIIPSRISSSAVSKKAEGPRPVPGDIHDDTEEAISQDIMLVQKRSSIDQGEDVEVHHKDSVVSIDTTSGDVHDTTDQPKEQKEEEKSPILSKTTSPTSDKSDIDDHKDKTEDLTIPTKSPSFAFSEKAESASPVAGDEHDDTDEAALQQNLSSGDNQDTNDQPKKQREEKKSPILSKSASPTSDKSVSDDHKDKEEDIAIPSEFSFFAVPKVIESLRPVAADKHDDIEEATSQEISPIQKKSSIDQGRDVEVQRKDSVVSIDTTSGDIHDTTDQPRKQKEEEKSPILSKSTSPTSDKSVIDDHKDKTEDLTIPTKSPSPAFSEKVESSSLVADDEHDDIEKAALQQNLSSGDIQDTTDQTKKQKEEEKSPILSKSTSPTSDKSVIDDHKDKTEDLTIPTKSPSAFSEKVESSSLVAGDEHDDIEKAALQQNLSSGDIQDTTDQPKKQREEEKSPIISKSTSPTSDKSATDDRKDEAENIATPTESSSFAVLKEIESSIPVAGDQHDDIELAASQHDISPIQKKSSIDQGKVIEVQRQDSGVAIDTAFSDIQDTTDQPKKQREEEKSPILSKSTSPTSDRSVSDDHKDRTEDIEKPLESSSFAVPTEVESSISVADEEHDDIELAASQHDILPIQKKSSIDQGQAVEVYRKDSVASIDTASSHIQNTSDQAKKQREEKKSPILSKSASPTSDKSVTDGHKNNTEDLTIPKKSPSSALSEMVESSSLVAGDEHDDIEGAALQQNLSTVQVRGSIDQGEEVEVHRKESLVAIDTAFVDIQDTTDQPKEQKKEENSPILIKSPSSTSEKIGTERRVDEAEDLAVPTKFSSLAVLQKAESSSLVAGDEHDDIEEAALQQNLSTVQVRRSIDQGEEVEVHRKDSVVAIDTASGDIHDTTDQFKKQREEEKSPILSKSPSPTSEKIITERRVDEAEDLATPTKFSFSAVPEKAESSSPVAGGKHDDIKIAALQQDMSLTQKRSSIDCDKEIEVQRKDSVVALDTGITQVKDTTKHFEIQKKEVKLPTSSKSPSPTSDKRFTESRKDKPDYLPIPTKLQPFAESESASSVIAVVKHDDIKTALQQDLTFTERKISTDEGKERDIQEELLRSDRTFAESSADASQSLKSPVLAQSLSILDKMSRSEQIVEDKDIHKESTVDQKDDMKFSQKEFTYSCETITRESEPTTEQIEDLNETEKLSSLSMPSSPKSDKTSAVHNEDETKVLKLPVTPVSSVVSEKATIFSDMSGGQSPVACDMDDNIGIITPQQDLMISHKDKLIDEKEEQNINVKELISPINTTVSDIQSSIDHTDGNCEEEKPKSPLMSASLSGDECSTDHGGHETKDPKLAITTSDQTKSIDEKQAEQSHGKEFESPIISQERRRSIDQLESCGDDRSITSKISISPCSDISIAEGSEIDSKDVKLSSSLQSLVELNDSRSSSQKDDLTYNQDQKEQYDEKSSSSKSLISNEKSSSTCPKEDQIQKIESTHLSVLLRGTEVIANEKKDDSRDHKSITALESLIAPEHEEFESKLMTELLDDADSTKLPTSKKVSQGEIPVDNNIIEEEQLSAYKPVSLSVIASSKEMKNLDQNLEDDEDTIQTEPAEDDSFVDQTDDCVNLKIETGSKPMSSNSDQTVDKGQENQSDDLKSSSATQSSILIEDKRNLIEEVKDDKYTIDEDIIIGQKEKVEEVSLFLTPETSVSSDKPQNLSANVDVQDTVKIIVSSKDSPVERDNLLDREDKLHHDGDHIPPTSPVTSQQLILTDRILEKEGKEKVITSSSPQKELSDKSKNLTDDGDEEFDSHYEIETPSEVLKTVDLLKNKSDKDEMSKTSKTTIVDTKHFTEKIIESGEDSEPSQSKRAYDDEDELASVCSKNVDESLADVNKSNIKLDEFNDERKYTLTQKNDIENYIMSEYVIKGRKIVSDNLEEIVNLYDVSKDIVVEIIEEICNKKNIEMEFIFHKDENIKLNTEYLVTKKEIQPTDLITDKKVDVENSEFLIKNKEQEEMLKKKYEFYDEKEKSSITEKKIMEVESKIQDKYINENNKISWSDLDEMEKTLSVPRYILIEMIEKLIIKMHLSRKTIYDQIILDESHDGNELFDRRSSKPATECESFECSTSQILDHDNKYESQFQMSFPSTITEMRTTHITTFSEQSADDLQSDPNHFLDSAESSRLTATSLDTKNIEENIISDRDVERETAKKKDISVKGETKTVGEMPEYDVIIKRTGIKSSLVEPEIKNEDESKTAVTHKESALERKEKYETDEIKPIESREKVHSYKSHLGMITSEEKSGRSTPERRDGFDSCSRTATPEGFRSEEVIRTTITTTRTISNEGEIVTTTKEVTETTNEHGETIVLAEKVDVMVADQGSSLTKLASVETDQSSEIQKSDSSCLGLQTSSSDSHDNNDQLSTHVWPKCEETTPKPETIETSSSISSQVYHCEMQSKPVEFSAADMSSSFYGQLPSIPPCHEMESSITLVSSNDGDDFTFKKVTTYDVLSDDMQLHQTTNIEKDDESRKVYEADEEKSSEAAKDPLKDWGKPMKLPPPERPDRFNFGNNTLNRSINIPSNSSDFDILYDWGKPMELPSPAFGGTESSDKTSSLTPRKDNKQSKKIISENLKNKKHSESPSKSNKKSKEINNKIQPIYLDLTFVPHHGNSYYTSFEFFKQIRARYYVFSGTEPSRDVYDALLNAKKTWENKDLEVTIIPTYDTDTLGYWVADNEEALAENHIDLSPSASRCTINLQDHETSCSAYRLEF
ncbi:Similar to futsch: Microtubule-associated protein futsch (Drosophila melanogaster) [Cotesia congregata]|uniref:Similar to futsch: Microtubule-associated protein futsch (Drosophila melanogaster) n=2 Tax=Braconidae TaxID=7402 RepID=A0A8J2MDR4_COTCN|nr:Similar to futsch: Microtubule-associated protein futsch (Drosophila melanogaster) [Cotesia congregata]